MKINPSLILSITLFSCFSVLKGAEPPPNATNPTPQMSEIEKTLRKTLEDLFETSKDLGKNPEKRQAFEQNFDWSRVSDACLASPAVKKQHLDPKSRERFQTLIRQLVAATAYNNMDRLWSKTTGYKIDKVTEQGNEVIINVVFGTSSGRKFKVDYFFYKKDGKWWIYDIANDDIKYTDLIREQVESFLETENSFQKLLRHLEKRLKEVSSKRAQGHFFRRLFPGFLAPYLAATSSGSTNGEKTVALQRPQ